MAEGQKETKRHIGRGMKPRGNKKVKPQKEKNQMAEQSTTEGQGTPSPEAVLDPQQGNETPCDLEPENGEKTLQILENSEATVAHDSGLEAALEQSVDVVDGEFADVDGWPTHCSHGKPIKEGVLTSCEQCQAADMGKAGLQFTAKPIPGREFSNFGGPTEEQLARSIYEDGKGDLETAMAVGTGNIKDLQGLYESVKFPNPPVLMVGDLSEEQLKAIRDEANDPGKLIWHPSTPAIGLQPDGSTKVIVTIQEGYWEPVQQWAADNGVSVEQWLSERLYEYISTYGEPAGKR